MNRRRILGSATAGTSIVGIFLFLFVFLWPSAEAHHYAPIQPGALTGGHCTLNLIFRDPEGKLYVGTAAHCAQLGSRVVAPKVGEFGTVVFRQYGNESTPRNDFALIAIDANKYPHVNPSVRFWGGPTGASRDPAPGTPTIHYGQGGFFEWSEPTRARWGAVEGVVPDGPYRGWFSATHVVMGGDSGSALLTWDGKALGVLSQVPAVGPPPGVVTGPTFDLIMELLQRAGWNLTLVTAPFAPLTYSTGLLERAGVMLQHCSEKPLADVREPDGCMRDAWYLYYQVSPDRPAARWNYSWPAMALPDPSACLPIVKTRISPLVRWCHESVLVLNLSGAGWATHTGGLDVTIHWPSASNDLDLYLFDVEGRILAASTNRSTTEEGVRLERPAPGHYRVVVVPVHVVDGNYTAQAALDFANISGTEEVDFLEKPSRARATPGLGLPAIMMACVASLYRAHRL